MNHEQGILWDFAQPETTAQYLDELDREETRRRVYNKLKANSHWLLLLRVARSIPQPFTLNDISVACHRAYPEAFGMKGYPHYPDNHKVHYILYGRRGLISHGLILRLRQGMFQLPDRSLDRHTGPAQNEHAPDGPAEFGDPCP